jgi:hypothetical protein
LSQGYNNSLGIEDRRCGLEKASGASGGYGPDE